MSNTPDHMPAVGQHLHYLCFLCVLSHCSLLPHSPLLLSTHAHSRCSTCSLELHFRVPFLPPTSHSHKPLCLPPLSVSHIHPCVNTTSIICLVSFIAPSFNVPIITYSGHCIWLHELIPILAKDKHIKGKSQPFLCGSGLIGLTGVIGWVTVYCGVWGLFTFGCLFVCILYYSFNLQVCTQCTLLTKVLVNHGKLHCVGKTKAFRF